MEGLWIHELALFLQACAALPLAVARREWFWVNQRAVSDDINKQDQRPNTAFSINYIILLYSGLNDLRQNLSIIFLHESSESCWVVIRPVARARLEMFLQPHIQTRGDLLCALALLQQHQSFLHQRTGCIDPRFVKGASLFVKTGHSTKRWMNEYARETKRAYCEAISAGMRQFSCLLALIAHLRANLLPHEQAHFQRVPVGLE